MAFRDPYMLVLDVFSEGKHFMDLMLLKLRRNPQGLVIAGQNGVVVVANPERRTRK